MNSVFERRDGYREYEAKYQLHKKKKQKTKKNSLRKPFEHWEIREILFVQYLNRSF